MLHVWIERVPGTGRLLLFEIKGPATAANTRHLAYDANERFRMARADGRTTVPDGGFAGLFFACSVVGVERLRRKLGEGTRV